MANTERMHAMSGEPVEITGIYTNEWGREESFRHGDTFPADPQLGTTAWKLIELVVPGDDSKDTLFDEHRDSDKQHPPIERRDR